MLTEQIDIYCERLDPGLWAEPVNALTNLAFLLAALAAWRLDGVAARPTGRALALALAAIGVASGLFHTTGQVWAAALDSLSILVFVLIYVFAANRDYLGLSGAGLWGATVAALPAIAALAALAAQIPALASSAAYAGVCALIAVYGFGLLWRAPVTGRGLLAGAMVLALSITARAADAPVCEAFPTGTHFLWHLLNAAMLYWMIRVWRDHMVAGVRARV